VVGVEVGDPQGISHFVIFVSCFVHFVDKAKDGTTMNTENTEKLIHEIHELHERTRNESKIVYNLLRSN